MTRYRLHHRKCYEKGAENEIIECLYIVISPNALRRGSNICYSYTIHHQVFEKILLDVYVKYFEKFEERTPAESISEFQAVIDT